MHSFVVLFSTTISWYTIDNQSRVRSFTTREGLPQLTRGRARGRRGRFEALLVEADGSQDDGYVVLLAADGVHEAVGPRVLGEWGEERLVLR